jgi:hypothetical protein
MTLRGNAIASEFQAVVENYIHKRFGPEGRAQTSTMALHD